MVQCSDAMVGIGGNTVTRDELIAARRMGKTVQYIAAEMDHEKAIRSARMSGQRDPTDFRGAAWTAFGSQDSLERA